MSGLRLSVEQLAVALGCGAWTALFLGDLPVETVLLLSLGSTVAVLLLQRAPVGAAMGVAAVQLSGSLLGVPDESPSGLAPLVVAVYTVGRNASRAAGYATVAVLACALGLVREPRLANVAFGGFLLLGIWWFGRLVRARTEAARRSRAEEDRLRGEDVSAHTRRVVAEESSRIAGDAVGVIRAAVDAMRREAIAAEETLEPLAIGRIQHLGAAAVGELRRLLGLLRDGPPSEPAAAESAVRRRWPTDTATALGLVALVWVDARMAGPGVSVLGSGLSVLVVLTVALRRSAPALAAGASAGVVVLSIALQAPLTHGFGVTVGFVLLVWAGVTAADRAARVGALVLAGAAVLNAWQADPANTALVAAMVALPMFAGRAWSERDREEQTSMRNAESLRQERRRSVEAALTAERLRIARELHDVASHAVGVMVLQASAAAAQRGSKPAEARAALRAVQTAGSDAAGELDVLLGVLDAGAVGPAGLARTGIGGLRTSLGELVDRMRGAGLHVEAVRDGEVEDPEVAGVVYRLVQECLTNALRHAPGSRVVVEVVAREGGVSVTVTDDGGASTGAADRPVADAGPGFGLVGVAERVRSCGGEVTAGPLASGGFRVEAQIPRRPASAGPAADPVARPMEQDPR